MVGIIWLVGPFVGWTIYSISKYTQVDISLIWVSPEDHAFSHWLFRSSLGCKIRLLVSTYNSSKKVSCCTYPNPNPDPNPNPNPNQICNIFRTLVSSLTIWPNYKWLCLGRTCYIYLYGLLIWLICYFDSMYINQCDSIDTLWIIQPFTYRLS